YETATRFATGSRRNSRFQLRRILETTSRRLAAHLRFAHSTRTDTMKHYLHTILKGACALSISALAVSAAYAQNYPDRPINMIVPFPAGSATDTVARLIGGKM